MQIVFFAAEPTWKNPFSLEVSAEVLERWLSQYNTCLEGTFSTFLQFKVGAVWLCFMVSVIKVLVAAISTGHQRFLGGYTGDLMKGVRHFHSGKTTQGHRHCCCLPLWNHPLNRLLKCFSMISTVLLAVAQRALSCRWLQVWAVWLRLS